MHDLARIVVDAIPLATLADADRRDAAQLLDACCAALEPDTPLADLSQRLGRLRRDGPDEAWLAAIREGIETAALGPVDRAALSGAFAVARVVLFDVHERRTLRQRERIRPG